MTGSARAALGRLLAPSAARALRLREAEDAPPPAVLFRPHATGRRYSTSHYNVVIPSLPAPHLFLGCAVFIGRTGTRTFDIDHAVAGTPRTTATLAFGTAATAPDWFGAYSTRTDCELRADGSMMRFGSDLVIEGSFPTYQLTARRPGFALDLAFTCTDQITWFVRGPLYDHYGYPARYEGTLTWRGDPVPISGVLSFEHARAMSLQALVDRPVPRALKLPVERFNYHVLAPTPDTMLMLTDVRALGRPLLQTAFCKQLDGTSARHVTDVEFEVLTWRDEPAIAPDGARTRIPHELRWRVPGGTEIVGTADTELIYGLGRGWLGGYQYSGRFDGTPVEGRAYYEYVDVRTAGR